MRIASSLAAAAILLAPWACILALKMGILMPALAIFWGSAEEVGRAAEIAVLVYVPTALVLVPLSCAGYAASGKKRKLKAVLSGAAIGTTLLAVSMAGLLYVVDHQLRHAESRAASVEAKDPQSEGSAR